MIKNEVDVDKILAAKWKIATSRFDKEYTKTSQFMLNSLDLVLSPLMLRSFQNVFIDDAIHEHEYIRPLFILFKIDNIKDWNRIYQDLVKHINYVSDYNVGQEDGKDLIMVVFKVPDKYADDYQLFRMGRYSKFSDAYKSKFIRYLNYKTKEESTIWQVLNKTDSIKRNMEKILEMEEGFFDNMEEVWEKPLKEREVYNYKSKKS